MAYQVTNARDAEQILERFNYFHDGFIKRVELISRDRFEQNGPEYTDRAHVCTGWFDVALDIAHYNYGQGEQPFQRVIQCRFQDVGDFTLDLRGHQPHDWPITRIDFIELDRSPAAIPHKSERAFEFRLMRPLLVDGSRWERQQHTLFSFARAEFEEGMIS